MVRLGLLRGEPGLLRLESHLRRLGRRCIHRRHLCDERQPRRLLGRRALGRQRQPRRLLCQALLLGGGGELLLGRGLRIQSGRERRHHLVPESSRFTHRSSSVHNRSAMRAKDLELVQSR